MSTLWLIPARGGSKGIPGKNLKPFCGESLVSRALRQALECSSPEDTVFVSTDSESICKESEKCGVAVPFMRPEALAADNSSTYDAILHALDEFKKRGKEFEKVVLLQPTSPFRTPEDIKGAINLWHPALDMVVSVCKSDANPYYNLFETDPEGFLHVSKGDGTFTRRQDAPEVWKYNGAVYVMTVKSLRESPIGLFKKVVPYIMPASRSVDLDTPEDWIMAELLYQRINKI